MVIRIFLIAPRFQGGFYPQPTLHQTEENDPAQVHEGHNHVETITNNGGAQETQYIARKQQDLWINNRQSQSRNEHQRHAQ